MLAAALGTGPADCPEPAVRRRHATRTDTARVVRTAVVACSAGRRVVVRRGLLIDPAGRRPRQGRIVTDVWQTGRRVAWGELRRSGGRVAGYVGVHRLRAARAERLHERRVSVDRRWPWVGVAVSSRGELAWVADGRVLVARGGGPARVVARGAYGRLVLEDDRTLRWDDLAGEIRFADLRPWRGRGCPRRERFRPAGASDEIVVTEAFYGDLQHFVRACVRGTRDDPVIARFIAELDGEFGEVLGVGGRWVVLLRWFMTRYDGCVSERVISVDAVARERGRAADIPRCDNARSPQKGEPVVVTDGGVPAWIVRTPDRSAVYAAGPQRGSVVQLDAAGPDGITGLVAEGRVVRWLRDGVARAAELG
jgi:hypothetical protein